MRSIQTGDRIIHQEQAYDVIAVCKDTVTLEAPDKTGHVYISYDKANLLWKTQQIERDFEEEFLKE